MPTSDATLRSTRGISGQMERFLDHLAVERGVAPNTRTAYRRDLGLYLKYLTARDVSDDRTPVKGHRTPRPKSELARDLN